MRRLKKSSELRVTDLCEGNSPVMGEFPAQGASNAENVSIWWRHHGDCGVELRGTRMARESKKIVAVWHWSYWTHMLQCYINKLGAIM